ncbi:hypothetical protein ACR3K2_30070 [Cryptosporidium serpentis]
MSHYIKKNLDDKEKDKLENDNTEDKKQDTGVSESKKAYESTENTNLLQSPQSGGDDIHDGGDGSDTGAAKNTLAKKYIDIDIEKSDPFASSLINHLQALEFCSNLYFEIIQKIIGVLKGSEMINLAKLAHLKSSNKDEKYDKTKSKLKQFQNLIKQYSLLLHKCIYIFVDSKVHNLTNNKAKPKECSLEEFKEKVIESQLLRTEINIIGISIFRLFVYRNNQSCTGYNYKEKIFCNLCIELDLRDDMSKRKLASLKEKYQKTMDFVLACESYLFQEKRKKSSSFKDSNPYKSGSDLNPGLRLDTKYRQSSNGQDKASYKKRIPYFGESNLKDTYTSGSLIKDNKQVPKAHNSQSYDNTKPYSAQSTVHRRISSFDSEDGRSDSSSLSTGSLTHSRKIPYFGEKTSKYSFTSRPPVSYSKKFGLLKHSGITTPKSPKDLSSYTKKSQLNSGDGKFNTSRHGSINSTNRSTAKSAKDLKFSASENQKSNTHLDSHKFKSGFKKTEYKDSKLHNPNSYEQMLGDFEKIDLHGHEIKYTDEGVDEDLILSKSLSLEFTKNPQKYPQKNHLDLEDKKSDDSSCSSGSLSHKQDFLTAQKRLSKFYFQTGEVGNHGIEGFSQNKNSISSKIPVKHFPKIQSALKSRRSDTSSSYSTTPNLEDNSKHTLKYKFPIKVSALSTTAILKPNNNKVASIDSDNSLAMQNPSPILKGILKDGKSKQEHKKNVRFKDK